MGQVDGLSILERLQRANPAAEIWWDSTPADFACWSRQLLTRAPDERTRRTWALQLHRFLDSEDPGGSLVRGVTTNPSLISSSIRSHPEVWQNEVRRQAGAAATSDVRSVFERVYAEAIRRAAHELLPIWENSGGRYGWVSAQVDPRYINDADRMLEQGIDLAGLAPNVMVKVPGSQEGYRSIRGLVARGISVNGTLSFTVAQFLSCIDAINQGREEATRSGVGLGRWRAVITHMIGRVGAHGDLSEEASARGLSLSQNDIRWAELAILKRIQGIVESERHPVKMLLSSLAVDDPAQGATSLSMHLEQTAGADIAYTCKPDFIEALMRRAGDLETFDPAAAGRGVPEQTWQTLSRLPSFRQALDPDGLEPYDFAHYGPFVAGYAEVSGNTRRLMDFVARQLEYPALGRRRVQPQPLAA